MASGMKACVVTPLIRAAETARALRSSGNFREVVDIGNSLGSTMVTLRRYADHIRHNQHGVAIGEKTVTRGDRMPIRIEHQVSSGKCRYEHQQRRFRQVEVGDERID